MTAAGDILIHPQLTDQAAKDAKVMGQGKKGLDFSLITVGSSRRSGQDSEAAGTAEEGGSRQVKNHRLVDVATALHSDHGLSEEQSSRYRLVFEHTQGTILNRGAAQDGLKPLGSLPDRSHNFPCTTFRSAGRSGIAGVARHLRTLSPA